MRLIVRQNPVQNVALRKESVDRNFHCITPQHTRPYVALRKESVDRNDFRMSRSDYDDVALRKESVDRNFQHGGLCLEVKRRSPLGERG